MRQVEFLQGCPLLHTLVLEGNPMDRLVEYRARVIFRLQGLMLLDRNKVGVPRQSTFICISAACCCIPQ